MRSRSDIFSRGALVHPCAAASHRGSHSNKTAGSRRPFSGDRQWLFLNSSADVAGYETVEIWMRRVEDMEGDWSFLASDVDGAIWSPDRTEMVYVTAEATGIWQAFPESAEITCWDTSPCWSYPISFSPDGRYVVLGGYSPG